MKFVLLSLVTLLSTFPVKADQLDLVQSTAESAVVQAAERETGAVCSVLNSDVLPSDPPPEGPVMWRYMVGVSCGSESLSYETTVTTLSVNGHLVYRASTPFRVN